MRSMDLQTIAEIVSEIATRSGFFSQDEINTMNEALFPEKYGNAPAPEETPQDTPPSPFATL